MKSRLSFCYFFYLNAAFDTINHTILLSRLHSDLGVCDVVVRWFRSWRSERKCVLTNGSQAKEHAFDMWSASRISIGPNSLHYTYTYACTYTYAYAYVYTYTYTCVYVYIYCPLVKFHITEGFWWYRHVPRHWITPTLLLSCTIAMDYPLSSWTDLRVFLILLLDWSPLSGHLTILHPFSVTFIGHL